MAREVFFRYNQDMKHGFLRAACVSPELKVSDTSFNSNEIIKAVYNAQEKNVDLLVFPELSLTGYTAQDLFLQKTLRAKCMESLKAIAGATKETDVLFTVGLPFEKDGALYNCAAFLYQGEVICLIPKTFIPNYGEFYECRWFTPYTSDKVEYVKLPAFEKTVPFGTNILIEDQNDPLVKIACEICEDVWVPLSPSTRHTLKGATVIANLSASNEVVGKADYRRLLISAQSAKTVSAYLYANAGHDESTSDMIFSGHSIIALDGSIKSESSLFKNTMIIQDLDLERIEQNRLRTTTFARCKTEADVPYTTVYISMEERKNTEEELLSYIDPHPFVPSNTKERKERSHAVIEMQSEGLARRLRHINAKSAVIGLSGGLDSTLALLVTARAFDKCGIPRSSIQTITMPAFGTTDRTYTNACVLAKETGASLTEINIKEAVNIHFRDIGQDPSKHDITYENCQARERTQILMDYANKTGGIVIGTGDLSELALGWCTYNGDHMSMYGVNSSIPKTLVRYLVTYFEEEAKEQGKTSLSEVLHDILDTPVSPELIPPEDGKISQKTEDIVGPYELHDFFLYYVLRWGFAPRKIYFLACKALLGKAAEGTGTVYTKEIIMKWLKSFYRRFFNQQFKRNCMPDGAKVGTVNLSPRGDWRMPSDASYGDWNREIEEMIKEEGIEVC